MVMHLPTREFDPGAAWLLAALCAQAADAEMCAWPYCFTLQA